MAVPVIPPYFGDWLNRSTNRPNMKAKLETWWINRIHTDMEYLRDQTDWVILNLHAWKRISFGPVQYTYYIVKGCIEPELT